MLNTANTNGKKTRENTSIFFAWNSKFLNHMKSLLDFLTGSLWRLNDNILSLKYMSSPVMNDSTRWHYLWTFYSSHQGILQQSFSSFWNFWNFLVLRLQTIFCELVNQWSWQMIYGTLRVTLWLNPIIFFLHHVTFTQFNKFIKSWRTGELFHINVIK